jgi:hypothetical protein
VAIGVFAPRSSSFSPIAIGGKSRIEHAAAMIIDGWSVAQDRLGAGVDVERDKAQRHRRVRQVVDLDVAFDYPAQPVGWNEMVAVPREATDDRPQADREGVRALDAAPRPREIPCRLRRLRTRCDECGV